MAVFWELIRPFHATAGQFRRGVYAYSEELQPLNADAKLFRVQRNIGCRIEDTLHIKIDEEFFNA